MRALSAADTFAQPFASGCGLGGVDVRAKIAVSLMASLSTMALSSLQAQLVLFALSLAYAFAMRRVKILVIGYALCVAMLIVAAGCGWLMHVLFSALPPVSLSALTVPFLRIATMLNVILPLAFSCRVQGLLTSLKSLHLPFVIYVPAAVMIRFIPTFLHDIRQVVETLRIRGYRLTPREALRHPLFMARLLFTPILFRSLKTSEELGIAAELKGLGYAKTMCPYRALIWKYTDTLLLGAALLVIAAAVGWEISLGDTVARGGMR